MIHTLATLALEFELEGELGGELDMSEEDSPPSRTDELSDSCPPSLRAGV